MNRNVRPRRLFPTVRDYQFPWTPNVTLEPTLSVEDHFNEYTVVVINLLPLLRHLQPAYHDIHPVYHHLAFSIKHEHQRSVYVTRFREIIDHLVYYHTQLTLPPYRIIHCDSNDWAYGHYHVEKLLEDAEYYRPVPENVWSIIAEPPAFDPNSAFHIHLLPGELRSVRLTIEFQAPAEVVEKRQLFLHRRRRFRRTIVRPRP